MRSTAQLRQIARDNVGAAVRIQVKAEQSDFVAPVVYSLAEAYAQHDVAWPRLVEANGEAVAFVMGAFEMGFEPTGQEFYGQVVGERLL